jgi:methylenetetrahydrofolate reductase (NADPH)
VNFQPCIRGTRSEDVADGWGALGGTVFRAAYLECFCPPELFEALRASLEKRGSLSFVASTAAGDSVTCRAGGQTAVDFGVFPGAGLVQPTVFCPEAFQAWKPEAFAGFEAWAEACEGTQSEGATASKVLRAMASSYHLVSVVDHDLSGDIFTAFHEAIMA